MVPPWSPETPVEPRHAIANAPVEMGCAHETSTVGPFLMSASGSNRLLEVRQSMPAPPDISDINLSRYCEGIINLQFRFWNQVGFRAKADFVLGLLPKHLSQLTQAGRRSPAFLDSPQTRDSFGLDGGLFDSVLVGVDCERELTREP
jgi:hypothetical protein